MVRKDDLRGSRALARLMRTPMFGWGVTIALAFALVCGVLAVWSREQPLVAVGQVMNETATVRVGFKMEDAAETQRERERARLLAPRVLVAEGAVLRELGNAIENLPQTLAALSSLDEVEESIRRGFRLTEDAFAAVRAEAPGGEVSPAWRTRADALLERLRRTPILDVQTWQRANQEGYPRFTLQIDSQAVSVERNQAVSVGNGAELHDVMTRLARDVGFRGPALTAVVNRLTADPRPTFRYDDALTVASQNDAAAAVRPVSTDRPPGQVIFLRGEVLDRPSFDFYRAELDAFTELALSWRVWLRYVSVMAAVLAITLALTGYTALFCPRIRRNPARMASVAVLLGATLAIACLATVTDPALLTLSAVAPTVFAAVILVIAYDQRVAMAFGALHGVLVCIALNQPIGVFALIITGVGVAVWQLKEIRHRNTVIRMGLYAGVALAVGTVLVALIDRPIGAESLRQTAYDALLAGFGGLLVGVTTLAILPSIERLFDITTGMTLIELRDPRHPLLRQLQQRAPGTYNHSLNVAAISEAASDSIGADLLLTYAGALYHDVGKMNKPDYFVENASGGPNKHDKLSPAMSLLVIVGHVKDGLELAREFKLPRTLQHFIEAHHGTTLVEYFYERARQRAEQGGDEPEDRATGAGPQEIEYRYPGPRPRTKEVAIVMLADSVESATRSMAEPTPSRIDALVRTLANKRLLDGQFDDCELTLRELQTIVASISKSVAAIYHGRIAYPSTAGLSGGSGGNAEKRA